MKDRFGHRRIEGRGGGQLHLKLDNIASDNVVRKILGNIARIIVKLKVLLAPTPLLRGCFCLRHVLCRC